jgi:molybdopterin/thiamine biosynthesis adenylyltransferase
MLTHAILVGCGNIGSHAVDQLARLPEVRRLTIIDFDHYETKNVASQQIDPRDVGQPKAKVLARRAKRIRPDLHVVPVVSRFENVPLGRLRGVLLAALDSRLARRHVNTAAWRLGDPWIDTAVEPTAWQVRANVYRPAPDAPCLECAWDDTDYAALEQVVPCQPGSGHAAATNAPASLGAIAASLMVLEYRKILAGDWDRVLMGRETFHDLKEHRQHVTRYRRNPQCRFDHEPWSIERVDGSPRTLADCFALSETATALRAVRGSFVRKLRCMECGHDVPVLRLSGHSPSDKPCPQCAERLVVSAFDNDDWLNRSQLTNKELARPLSRIGFQSGDVITLRNSDGLTRFELPLGDTSVQSPVASRGTGG